MMNIDDYDQISEEKMRQMAASTRGNAATPFEELLKLHDEWKEAGCTPVFIVTRNADDHMIMACVSRETFNVNLN